MKFKLSLLNSLILLVSTSGYADQHAQQVLEQDQDKILAQNLSNHLSFNSASLFGNQNNVDLSHFQIQNYIAPGEYLVKLDINAQEYIDASVQFDHLDASQSAVLCVDDKLIEKLDLKKAVKQALIEKKSDQKCLNIKDVDPNAYYDFDKSTMGLAISLPQAISMDRPKGYIDPKLFNDGVNSAFVGYDFNYNREQDHESKYLSLRGGLNLGGWYFRHAGAFESDSFGWDEYYSTQNVLYKDITQLKARLSLGQFYSQGYSLDSLPIVGAQFASDQDMLPWSDRHYSPIIRNFAHTNALVRIYQNGQKVYERTVPAGPFELNDVNTLASGDITVEITETGGEKRSFILPLQSSQELVRAGRYNYSVSVGRYFLRNKVIDDNLGQASFNYGLNNNMTLISGLTLSKDYHAALLAVALNTPIGGMTIKTEMTDADLYGKNYSGYQYGLNYRYAWLPQGFNLSADYRRYDQDYLSTSSFFYQQHFNELSDSERDNFYYNYNLQENIGLSISKQFENRKWGGLNFSVSKNKYWDNDQNYYQYNFGYSNIWEKLSYRIGYTRTDYSERDRNQGDNIYVSFSMPLDWRSSRGLYANGSINRDQDSQTNANFSVSGSLDQDNKLNFGMGLSKNGSDDPAFYGNLNYLLPQVRLGSTLSIHDHTQYSLSASGAVVAHRYGITPVNALADTFTIVHVDGGQGAKVDNAWGVKLDRFGNAVQSNASAYAINRITINPEDLDGNISLLSNQSQVIPRKYSSQMAVFEAEHASNVILRIRYQQQAAALGSQLIGHDQQNIGVVGAGGQLIAQQTAPLLQQSTLRWGSAEHERCVIQPLQQDQLIVDKNEHFKIINLECN